MNPPQYNDENMADMADDAVNTDPQRNQHHDVHAEYGSSTAPTM